MNEDRQQWDINSGAGATALVVAGCRALESRRPDALVHDPYAEDFLAAAGSPLAVTTPSGEPREAAGQAELWEPIAEYVGVRTRVFDDFLTGAVDEGMDQVVILASGLDTRPFRLPWPDGIHVFELDQPLVLDFKLRVLRDKGVEAGCTHTPVPVDLRGDWAGALEAAGFDPSRPTAWLAEGLLPYLPPEAEERLFKDIDQLSAGGSRAAVEHADRATELLADPQVGELAEELGLNLSSLLPSGDKRTLEDQLTTLGWEYETRTGLESARRLGRTLDGVSTLTGLLKHTFTRRA